MPARDAGRTRERLIQAATALFSERGYDATTTRDIGDRAGVDPALIGRYFGGKGQLYVAALRAEGPARGDLLDADRVAELLARIEDRGPGPILRAAVHGLEDTALHSVARELLADRLVTPLATRFRGLGASDPQLRAELAVAAFTGIALARSSGSLPTLQAAGQDEVLELTTVMLGGLAGS